MAGLAERRLVAERMDDPDLEAGLHLDALRGLERINRASRTAGALWPFVSRLAPGRLLDIACGGGDVALALAGRARREGVDLRVAGCDRSPRAVAYARSRGDMEFFECDALGDGFPEGFDIYCCSLFLHHLTDDQVVGLLRRMASGRGLVASDLVRGPAGYGLAYLGARVLTRSPVVHEDALRSVRGAYRMDELAALARKAGLEGATLRRSWPCRMVLEWTS